MRGDTRETVCLLLYNKTTGEGPPGIDCAEYLKSIEYINKADILFAQITGFFMFLMFMLGTINITIAVVEKICNNCEIIYKKYFKSKPKESIIPTPQEETVYSKI
jgi:hypothetical protein